MLDREALSRHFQIASYQDALYTGEAMPDEQEECVVTPRIERLDQYLAGVVVDPRVIERAFDKELMLQAESEVGWPFPAVEDGGEAAARSALEALRDSAKLNPDELEFSPVLLGNFSLPVGVQAPIALSPLAQAVDAAG